MEHTMTEIYENPPRNEWPRLCTRPAMDLHATEQVVQRIMDKVRVEGDTALYQLTKNLDGVDLSELFVKEEEFREADELVSDELKAAISLASRNIRLYHQQQMEDGKFIETMAGVRCWQKRVAIPKVGLYVPGGSAPLFSTVLMLTIPAVLAACQEIILCTPPPVHPAIIYAARLNGVSRILKVGGAQAIAALTLGTESVPKVDKIFGPGNRYVTLAKQLATGYGVAIDMPAGPSEVLVIADEKANAGFIAADLLAQAEHGADSQVILLCTEPTLIEQVLHRIKIVLPDLNRKESILSALKQSRFIVFPDLHTALDFSNTYAPEHLILNVQDPSHLVDGIRNAGSVFLGPFSPESVGDYASGPNHTLPTNGYARNYSGLSVSSFQKDIFFQQITEQGLQNIGPAVVAMSRAEQLQAHGLAVEVRLQRLKEED